MILEALVTTINADSSPNIAPMGPRVGESLDEFVLRPFRASTTFANLRRAGQGVLHVSDDVELFARAAIDVWERLPPWRPAAAVRGYVLTDACRWHEFEVADCDDSAERATVACRTVLSGRQRDFFGFNRGKHAVIEAAILATRIGILPDDELQREFARLAPPIEKTGGPAEKRAYALLGTYLQQRLQGMA